MKCKNRTEEQQRKKKIQTLYTRMVYPETKPISITIHRSQIVDIQVNRYGTGLLLPWHHNHPPQHFLMFSDGIPRLQNLSKSSKIWKFLLHDSRNLIRRNFASAKRHRTDNFWRIPENSRNFRGQIGNLDSLLFFCFLCFSPLFRYWRKFNRGEESSA